MAISLRLMASLRPAAAELTPLRPPTAFEHAEDAHAAHWLCHGCSPSELGCIALLRRQPWYQAITDSAAQVSIAISADRQHSHSVIYAYTYGGM